MFKKIGDDKWKKVKDGFKKLKKAKPEEYDDCFLLIKEGIPEYTSDILKECLTKMVEILGNRSYPQTTVELVIDMFYNMTKKYDDKNKDTNPFPFFEKNSFIIPALFDLMDTVNHKVSATLLNIWVNNPTKIQEFIIEHQEPIQQIMSVVSQEHDKKYAELLLLIITSTEQIKEIYIPLIKDYLPKWTPTLVIHIWIGNPDTVSVIPKQDVEGWLVSYKSFEIDDVEQVTKIHQFLWEKESIILLMIRTVPANNDNAINFLHRAPELKFDICKEIVAECCESLKKANEVLEQFKTKEKEDPSPTEDTDPETKKKLEAERREANRMTYHVIRYFVLSYCNPEYVDQDTITLLERSITDNNDYIAAAAAQVFFTWEKKFSSQGPFIDMRRFYLIAASIINREENNMCRVFLQGMLSNLAQDNEVFLRILIDDHFLRGQLPNKAKITRESFVFSHMKNIYTITQIKDISHYAQQLISVAQKLELDKIIEQTS